ncbi:MAG: helix-turn-helix transcriptional regulator [Microbacterium sp.]|uniref:LuxR C-terminal-related transcriptional regulator n=1 Tax=Microbacterium sp. TaxID=51671 RepID=UPI001ACF754F|nr:LuxR C-terminal-related transcriptional regulator [Microbacterium sp.]MBN9176884.1 helix-turn-helix transcriptional regulator [Microbacterium sp.]
MDRIAALREATDLVVAGHSARPADGAADPEDGWSLALASFAASFAGRHDEALGGARRALVASANGDAAERVLAAAVRALAAAGCGISGTWRDTAPGETTSGDPLMDTLPLLARLGDGDADAFARYAFAEAALTCARVGLAHQAAAGLGDVWLGGHPFGAVMGVLRARAFAFSGRIDDAIAVVRRIPRTATRIDLLVDATRAFIAGNAADRADVLALVQRIEDLPPAGLDRLDGGAVLLGCYGLLGLGEPMAAGRLVSRFGWDDAMVIDRALVHELFVEGAVRVEDAEAADAWLARAEEADGDPIADSTLDRTRSRAALAAGRVTEAALAADRAVAAAEREGRVIEAMEGRIVAARARVSAGRSADAARLLRSATRDAERDGHRSMRRQADRVLRATGRRLPPAHGAALSAREAHVCELMLRGCENLEIAALLDISENTVRGHVSRVLAAHGVHTRIALIARAHWPDGACDVRTLTGLTPRQRAVVAELIGGRGTAEIAARMGVRERTIEKHLDDVKERWGCRTRVDIVRYAAALAADAVTDAATDAAIGE